MRSQTQLRGGKCGNSLSNEAEAITGHTLKGTRMSPMRASPEVDTDWDPEEPYEEWGCKYFLYCITHGLKGSPVKPVNHTQLSLVHQGDKETPSISLQWLKETWANHTLITLELSGRGRRSSRTSSSIGLSWTCALSAKKWWRKLTKPWKIWYLKPQRFIIIKSR